MLVIHNIQPLHCIAKADPAESLFEMCDFHCGTVSGQPSPAQSTTRLQRAPSLNRTIQSTVEGKLHCNTITIITITIQ